MPRKKAQQQGMQNKPSVSCPVHNCSFEQQERKRVLAHLHNKHGIPLNNHKSDLKGENMVKGRKKHAKRFARWLEDQGVPVDMSFFTEMSDQLERIDGWEDVGSSEDEEAGDGKGVVDAGEKQHVESGKREMSFRRKTTREREKVVSMIQ